MRKRFYLVMICLLGFIFYYMNDALDQERFKAEIESYLHGLTDQEAKYTEPLTITQEQIYQGNLLLINSIYPVHETGVRTDIIPLSEYPELISGYALSHSGIYMSEEIVRKFSEMVHDAAKEGVNHFIINSGYRNLEEQAALYQEMGSGYALPAGYSEHNSGLSLDVGSRLGMMEQAPEGTWIEQNAWKYGFILRYPKDKTDVTGIQYEPWHIRYVGLPHSVVMKEKNFVLEEYLEYLKEQMTISVTINDDKYRISYYPVSDNPTILVPADLHWEISGDNMEGVIVTTFID